MKCTQGFYVPYICQRKKKKDKLLELTQADHVSVNSNDFTIKLLFKWLCPTSFVLLGF